MQFFAGANTRVGFVSLFDEALKGVERIFILKGTSGCGKSTLMRKAATYASSRSLGYDLIFCSGDPASLDGIIIKPLSTAIIDGTSPHVAEPRYPIIKESIVDLGRFIDKKKLQLHANRLIKLMDEKSERYSRAYKNISAAGELRDVSCRLVKKYYDRSLSDKRAKRLLETVAERSGERRSLFASAFTFDGIVTMPAFGDVNTVYRVPHCHGCEYYFVAAIADHAHELGMAHTVSYDPTDPAKADNVFFPSSRILVSASSKLPASSVKLEKKISVSRFISENIQDIKLREKTLSRIRNEIADDARFELAEARRLHEEIEKIYTPAVDFDTLNDFSNDFLKIVFEE